QPGKVYRFEQHHFSLGAGFKSCFCFPTILSIKFDKKTPNGKISFRQQVIQRNNVEDRDRLLSFEKVFIGVNGCSLKTNENLEVLRGIPVERLMIETDSPYCDIINTHAGSQYVKSVWPSKKKEKYEPDSTVKGRNEPCLVRQVLEVVAGRKGISDIEGLSRTLYRNTCRLFFPQDLDVSANAQLESGTVSGLLRAEHVQVQFDGYVVHYNQTS
uniref:Sodium/hydrogen exchanger 2 n=1 Tax=Zea mays TaxID=4577 RepID=A0A804LCY2_MAIZE